MTLLSSKVEEIIKNLKSDHSLDEVRFVKAYNGRLREAPMESILVTVGVGVNSTDSFMGGYHGSGFKGEKVSSQLVLNVYCPYANGGDGITHTVNTIVNKIPGVDQDKIVSGIDVSEIKFSKKYEAVYRTVNVHLDYCVCQSNSSTVDEENWI